MSGGGGSTSTTTSQSGPPPQVLAAYQHVQDQANNVANQPLQQYTGPMVAGFAPAQLAAMGTVNNAQGISQPYINQAAQDFQTGSEPIQPTNADYVTQLSALSPQVATAFTQPAQQYGNLAGNIAGNIPGAVNPYATSASQGINLPGYDTLPTYFNPYQQAVTATTQGLFNQQNAQQLAQVRGNAASQNAYGGDREAVAEALTAQQQQIAEAPVLAGIQQQGFAQAQQELNTQQQLQLQRQQAERQLALGSGQLTLGAGQGAGQLALGAGQENLGAGQLALSGMGQGIQGGLGAGQLGVGAQQATGWLQQGAGAGNAALGHQTLGDALAGASAQYGMGTAAQQQMQSQLNVPYEQFLQQQAYPFQTTGWLANIAEGLGSGMGGNSSTTSPGPSLLGQVAGAGTAGLGALGATGAFGSNGYLTGSNGIFGSGASSNFADSAPAIEGINSFGGGADFIPVASGGRVGYAGGGGLPPPPFPMEHGIPGGVPGMPDVSIDFIPGPNTSGAHGIGTMQPDTKVTTETSGGGHGGLFGLIGTAVGLATGIPILPGLIGSGIDQATGIARGGAIPGFADGGTPNPAQTLQTVQDKMQALQPQYQTISGGMPDPVTGQLSPKVLGPPPDESQAQALLQEAMKAKLAYGNLGNPQPGPQPGPGPGTPPPASPPPPPPPAPPPGQNLITQPVPQVTPFNWQNSGLHLPTPSPVAVHSAVPQVSDLAHTQAPTSPWAYALMGGPQTTQDVLPQINFSPNFSPYGFPTTPMYPVGQDFGTSTPYSTGMSGGVLQHPNPNGVAAAPASPPPPASTIDPQLQQIIDALSGSSGGSSGWRGGAFPHYDAGGGVPGLSIPDPSQSFIPDSSKLAAARAHTIPAPPPASKPENIMNDVNGISSGISGLKKIFKGDDEKSESFGGRVGYDYGGTIQSAGQYVSGGMDPFSAGASSLQRFQQMPEEKLRELSVQYPPNSQQGQAVRKALQMKMMSPSQDQQNPQQAAGFGTGLTSPTPQMGSYAFGGMAKAGFPHPHLGGIRPGLIPHMAEGGSTDWDAMSPGERFSSLGRVFNGNWSTPEGRAKADDDVRPWLNLVNPMPLVREAGKALDRNRHGYADGGDAVPVAPMLPTQNMTLADKLARIDLLTRDRWAADRGERADGSPSRSFTSIATGSTGYGDGGAVDGFQDWKARNAPHDSGADYDLRGAYRAGLQPSQNGHWSDEFKLPNHPTFSEESRYARPGIPAGSWGGPQHDIFIPPAHYADGGAPDDAVNPHFIAPGGVPNFAGPRAGPPAGFPRSPTDRDLPGRQDNFFPRRIGGYAEGGAATAANPVTAAMNLRQVLSERNRDYLESGLGSPTPMGQQDALNTWMRMKDALKGAGIRGFAEGGVPDDDSGFGGRDEEDHPRFVSGLGSPTSVPQPSREMPERGFEGIHGDRADAREMVVPETKLPPLRKHEAPRDETQYLSAPPRLPNWEGASQADRDILREHETNGPGPWFERSRSLTSLPSGPEELPKGFPAPQQRAANDVSGVREFQNAPTSMPGLAPAASPTAPAQPPRYGSGVFKGAPEPTATPTAGLVPGNIWNKKAPTEPEPGLGIEDTIAPIAPPTGSVDTVIPPKRRAPPIINATGPEGAPPATPVVARTPGLGPAPAEAGPKAGSKWTWDQASPVLMRFESEGGKNIPNYRYDSTHTAGGYYQITDTNWRNVAPRLGIDTNKFPTAMSASFAQQNAVAKEMFENRQARGGTGFEDWEPFNDKMHNFLRSHGAPETTGGGEKPNAPADAGGSGSRYQPDFKSMLHHEPRPEKSDFDKWLPLISAGFGMMASRSPFIGNAIGDGGLQGVKTYEQLKQQDLKNDLAHSQLDVRAQAVENQARHYFDMAQHYIASNDRLTAKDKELAEYHAANAAMRLAQIQAQIEKTGITNELASQRAAAQAQLNEARVANMHETIDNTVDEHGTPGKTRITHNPDGTEKREFFPSGKADTVSAEKRQKMISDWAIKDPEWMTNQDAAIQRATDAYDKHFSHPGSNASNPLIPTKQEQIINAPPGTFIKDPKTGQVYIK